MDEEEVHEASPTPRNHWKLMATKTGNEFLQWCNDRITLPSMLAEATLTEPSGFHTVQKDIKARRQLVGRKGIGGKRREEKGKWKIFEIHV